MNSPTFILLATFNGEEYLANQFDSLLNQSETQWKLLIRDDGSKDSTLKIIQNYVAKDNRIQFLDHSKEASGSVLTNFSALMIEAYEQGAEYIFCCDQDDVWEADKLELMVARLKQLEGDRKSPALVHHDLTVVSESLEPVADSFIEMMNLQPSGQTSPQRLISRNEVTGCAMVFNRALLEIALPISDQAVMHDWWLAMCAGFFGRLDFVSKKLVKYRQHDNNAIGAKSFWHGLNPFTNWVSGWRRGDEEFISTVRQAKAFREAMSERLKSNSEACATLDLYAGLVTASRWQRLRSLRRFGLWRSHWLLNVVLVMRMLLLPKEAKS